MGHEILESVRIFGERKDWSLAGLLDLKWTWTKILKGLILNDDFKH